MEQYLDQIKQQGFSTITVEDSFDDGQFAQVAFRDNIGSSHVAMFKNNILLMIV